MTDLPHIAGVGIDLCDVARIERMLKTHGDAFLKRIFTDDEIAYCSARADSAQCYAARFAAKEAMSKALGTGFSGGVTPKGLSVGHGEMGEPTAVLDSAAKAVMQKLGAKKMLISLTHIKDSAEAIAVLSR